MLIVLEVMGIILIDASPYEDGLAAACPNWAAEVIVV